MLHVHADEQRCPFCGAALMAPSRPAARIFAAVAMVGIATACSAYGPCGDCGTAESSWQANDDIARLTNDGPADLAATDLPDGASVSADVVDRALDASAADAAEGASSAGDDAAGGDGDDGSR